MRACMHAMAPAVWLAIGLGAAPAQADDYYVGNWHVMEAEDTGLPLAVLPTPQSLSVGALVLVCTETGGMVLRLDIQSEARPSIVQVRSESGQTADLHLDDDGSGSEANLIALKRLYAKSTGSADNDPPTRVEISLRADTEGKWVRYNLQGLNMVLQRVSAGCGSEGGPAQVATATPTPGPVAPRSKVAANYEDYCRRYAQGENTKPICACLVDNIIRVADRDNPGVPRYADVVLTTIRAYREANITGSSPQFSVRMALVGHPGNPAADPIALISRSIEANDEAVAQCAPQ